MSALSLACAHYFGKHLSRLSDSDAAEFSALNRFARASLGTGGRGQELTPGEVAEGGAIES